MGQCTGVVPVGYSGCVAAFNKIRNIMVMTKGSSFVDIDDANNFNSHKVKIQALTYSVISVEGNYERTTPDVEMQTNASGDTYVANRPKPAFNAKARMTYCDYKALLQQFTGGIFDAFFSTEGGEMVMYRKNTNKTVYGFRCRITAVTKGIPDAGAIGDFFEVMFHFTDYKQFEDGIMFTPDAFNPDELLDEMPNGLSISIKTPYTDATDLVVVYAYDRCGAAKTGLILANWTISRTNLASNAISAMTDNSDGTYDLTIDASGTGMTVAEYAIIQVVKGTSPAITDVSNLLTVQGGA